MRQYATIHLDTKFSKGTALVLPFCLLQLHVHLYGLSKINGIGGVMVTVLVRGFELCRIKPWHGL